MRRIDYNLAGIIDTKHTRRSICFRTQVFGYDQHVRILIGDEKNDTFNHYKPKSNCPHILQNIKELEYNKSFASQSHAEYVP